MMKTAYRVTRQVLMSTDAVVINLRCHPVSYPYLESPLKRYREWRESDPKHSEGLLHEVRHLGTALRSPQSSPRGHGVLRVDIFTFIECIFIKAIAIGSIAIKRLTGADAAGCLPIVIISLSEHSIGKYVVGSMQFGDNGRHVCSIG